MPQDPAPSGPGSSGPNCYQCRHFAVSWDPRLPYACKRLGFKSRTLPAIEVLRIDGVRCRGFDAKPTPEPPRAAPVAAQRPASPGRPHTAALSPDAPLSTFRRLA